MEGRFGDLNFSSECLIRWDGMIGIELIGMGLMRGWFEDWRFYGLALILVVMRLWRNDSGRMMG